MEWEAALLEMPVLNVGSLCPLSPVHSSWDDCMLLLSLEIIYSALSCADCREVEAVSIIWVAFVA